MTALNLIYDFVNGNKSENDAEPDACTYWQQKEAEEESE
jgi:hypothetical protein